MHIVIAPNAFKNSLAAGRVATCIEAGLQQSRLPCTCVCIPVADGGDGTADLLIEKFNGLIINGAYTNPLGRKINALFGLIDSGRTAVIEMAAASGLRLLNKGELNPLRASSAGTGQMIISALDKGAKKIILTLGGSATVDGGCGILHALGIRFRDASGKELIPFPGELAQVTSIDASGLDARIKNTEIEIWCDVNNNLLGPSGAAAMFGPQKGASEKDVVELEYFLNKLNEITIQATGISVSSIQYGGAAGGTAAFLHAFLQAKLLNGISSFLNIVDFENVLNEADLVITGEGEIDIQTLQGKGPFGVASMAKKKNVPVIALAGKVPITYYPELSAVFDILLAINNQPLPLEEALRLTESNLIRVSREIGNLIFISDPGNI